MFGEYEQTFEKMREEERWDEPNSARLNKAEKKASQGQLETKL